MSDWKECKLQDVVSKLGDGLHGTPQYDNGGEYFFINGNNLIDGKIVIKENTQRVSRTEYSKYKKELNDRTILLGINGTIGNVALYNNEKCILGKSACYFNVKNDVDKHFIKYVVTNKHFQDYIETFAHGTTIKNVSLQTVREYPFKLPSLTEQKSIANILSCLDDKIDLLHRQNKTFDQLAETLFRQWFVEEAEWEGSLSEYVKVQGGYAFKSTDFRTSGFARVIKIRNISMGSIDIRNSDFVDESVVNSIDRRFKIRSGDFLIAMTGAEIGKIGIVEKTESEIWLNQRVGKLEEKVPYGNIIGYLALSSSIGQDHITNACAGSAQENISTTGIEEMIFASYNSSKANSFGKEAQPLFDKIIFNQNQVRTLTQLRDTILPKLMSGELRVK